MKCWKHQVHIGWTHHQQTTEAKQEEMKYHINTSLSPSLEAQILEKHSFLDKMKFNH